MTTRRGINARRQRSLDYRARIAERNIEIVELTHRGWSAPRIAEKLGITTRTVARVRVKTKSAFPKPPLMTGDELVRAAAMLDDGWSYREVGRALDRDETTISKRFPGRGWDSSTTNRYMAYVRELKKL